MPGACAPSTSVVDAARGELGDQPRDRQDQRRSGSSRGRAARAACAASPRASTASTTSLRRRHGNGTWPPRPRARPARRHEVERVAAGVVGVVGGEQLVARRERQRAQHGVDAGGGVAHEGEVVGIGAHERGQRGPRDVEQRPRARARGSAPARASSSARSAPGARGPRSGRRRRSRGSGTSTVGSSRHRAAHSFSLIGMVRTPEAAGTRRSRRRAGLPGRSVSRPRDTGPRSGCLPAARRA